MGAVHVSAPLTGLLTGHLASGNVGYTFLTQAPTLPGAAISMGYLATLLTPTIFPPDPVAGQSVRSPGPVNDTQATYVKTVGLTLLQAIK